MLECIGFSEIDRDASAVLRYRYPDITNFGDANKIVPEELPDFDLFCAGFPCQSFSIAGKRQGFNDTRGTLFFEIARILSHKRPAHFILENVRGLVSADEGKAIQQIFEILTELDYFVEMPVLNSSDFLVPQNRERCIFVGHLGASCSREILSVECGDEEPYENGGEGIGVLSGALDSSYHKGPDGKRTMIQLEDNKGAPDAHRIYDAAGLARTLKGEGGGVGAKTGLYALTEQGTPQRNRVYDSDGIAPTIPSSEGRGGQAPAIVHSLFPRTGDPNKGGTGAITRSDGTTYCLDAANSLAVQQESRVRRLTPIECARLQHFPNDWADIGINDKGEEYCLSDTAKYRVFGNAVTTSVIEAVVRRMREVGCLNL